MSLRPACGIIFLTKILVVKMKEGSDDLYIILPSIKRPKHVNPRPTYSLQLS